MASRTLSKHKREGGISLEMLQQKRASARFEERISWFFSCCSSNSGFLSSYNGELRDPLLSPQESAVCMRVVRGLSGCFSIQCQSYVITWR